MHKIEIKLKDLTLTRDALHDLLAYKTFGMIDWYSVSKKIEQIKEELEDLCNSSDILETLQNRLLSVKRELEELNVKSEKSSKNIGSLENDLERLKKELIELRQEKLVSQELILKLGSYISQEELTLTNIGNKEGELRKTLQLEIDSIAKKLRNSLEKIQTAMNQFISKFSVESQELDASLASLEEFRAKLSALEHDDLPRFEKRFKELFKEKTIQKTAMIQAELEHHSKEIESKIEKINNSLADIEYNSGTYITLIAEPSNIKEIREFKQNLKSAISYAISDDNSYDEAKFLEIKSLIDKFNGREGTSEVDKRWRLLVTDVRNWFNFSASERYVSDKSEKEYYAHSGGKSGGQKEKLAYTVLASSLAFQFGLEYNEVRSRSFRFVMIDEAFGKGSDESSYHSKNKDKCYRAFCKKCALRTQSRW